MENKVEKNTRIDGMDQKKIGLIVEKVNNKSFVNYFAATYRLVTHNEMQKKKYSSVFERHCKDKKLFVEYLKNKDIYLKGKKLIGVNEYYQKIIFCYLISIDFDEDYFSKKYYVSKNAAYKQFIEESVFKLALPNKRCENQIEVFEFSIDFLLSQVELASIEGTYEKYSVDQNNQFVIETIKKSPYFDVKFYLNNNQDVKNSGVDPYYHYSVQGFKEGRAVSYFFDPVFYIKNNKDVDDAGINPVYHYTVSGVKEGRISRNIISKFMPSLSYESKKTTPEVVDNKLGKFIIKRNKYTHLILVHDDLRSRTGGIQKVVANELREINSEECLIISPTAINDIFLIQEANGMGKGYATSADIRLKIKNVDNLIVHSLINFNLHELKVSRIFDSSKKISFWFHDYSPICQNFLLLRNNYEICGAPALDSTACGVCCYGRNRAGHVKNYEEIFEKYRKKIKIITPSEASKALINNFYKKLKPKIREHYSIDGIDRKVIKKINDKNKLNVAYVGTDQPHKGLGYFIAISSIVENANYYLFSEKNKSAGKIKYVSCSAENPVDTAALLIAMDIDVLILPSKWEETFCLTAYEALSSGVRVLCFENSGNLSDLANKIKEVNEFKDFGSMVDYLRKLTESKDLVKNYFKLKDNMNMRYVHD